MQRFVKRDPGVGRIPLLTLLALGVIALAAGACSEQSVPVAPSNAPSAAQPSAAVQSSGSSEVQASGVGGTPTIQAGGQGKFVNPDCEPATQRTFSFNALAGPGGQTGHAQLYDRECPAPPSRGNFVIDCVRYFEAQNVLLLGLELVNGSGGPPVGTRAITAVRDNGEGRAAGPDQITGFAPVGALGGLIPECSEASPEFVEFLVNFPNFMFPITQGNIQVRVSG